MITNTKTKNYTLSVLVEEYLQEKLRAAEKLLDTAAVCDVELETLRDKDAARYRVEANIDTHGTLIRAEARAESMNAAIDEMKDELLRQLKRRSDKKHSAVKRSGAKLKEQFRFGV